MQNISIYYGPKSGFNKILKFDAPAITLTSMAILSDKKMREHSFKLPNRKGNDSEEKLEDLNRIKIPNLVAFSDEYAALSENAIQGFLSFLSQFDIDNIFLQNPPAYIVSQFNKLELKVNVLQYVYNSVTTNLIKNINKEFSSEIIGQESVKNKLMSTLYQLCNVKNKKPVVMLFYGPTGIGKTETGKFLSTLLKQQLFRKQFSMFNSEEFASYLFGGKHSQNCLAKELLERESNIILFDEFDKIHPVFHSAFYQLFDEGIYEDKNYYVILERSVIICTSNYSSLDEIKKKLGAPIYSRFDAIIKYNELDVAAIKKIIEKEYIRQFNLLDNWEQDLIKNKNTFNDILSISDNIENARQINHLIKDKISSILVQHIINN